jgi:UDP-N-acetylmuramate dehydrogenase
MTITCKVAFNLVVILTTIATFFVILISYRMSILNLRGELRYQEPMAHHTSWRVGGPAEKFYYPADLEDLGSFLRALPKTENLFWCGLGSNTLVRDQGLLGTVIATQKFLNRIDLIEPQLVRAEAGVSCATLARFTARQSLAGLEFLAGVPGTVGGALAMNAGCHGGETWPQVQSVELVNRLGEVSVHSVAEFHYQYRQVQIPKDHWFVAGYFQLTPGDKETSLQIIRDLLARRAATQPTNEPSGGSTFRNPPGDYAARLIEAAGLKGYRIGGAMVSPKHANFIVSSEGCLAADIEALIQTLQQKVQQQFGILLELEVRIVGD